MHRQCRVFFFFFFFWLTTCVFPLDPNNSFLCSCVLLSPSENPYPQPFPAFNLPLENRGSQWEHCSFGNGAVVQCPEAWWASLTAGACEKGSHRYCASCHRLAAAPPSGGLAWDHFCFVVLCVTLACNQQRKYSLLPDCLPKTISIIPAFQWMKKPFRLAREIRLTGSVN